MSVARHVAAAPVEAAAGDGGRDGHPDRVQGPAGRLLLHGGELSTPRCRARTTAACTRASSSLTPTWAGCTRASATPPPCPPPRGGGCASGTPSNSSGWVINKQLAVVTYIHIHVTTDRGSIYITCMMAGRLRLRRRDVRQDIPADLLHVRLRRAVRGVPVRTRGASSGGCAREEGLVVGIVSNAEHRYREGRRPAGAGAQPGQPRPDHACLH